MNIKQLFAKSSVAFTAWILLLAACTESGTPFYKMVKEAIPPPPGYGSDVPLPGDGLRVSSYEKLYITNLNTPVNWDLSNMVSIAKGPFTLKSLAFVNSASQGQAQFTSLAKLLGSYNPALNFRGRDRVQLELIDNSGAHHQFLLTFLVQSLVHELQPALAVRATGCIMCHAQVASNVVTDFGRGLVQNNTDLFFGQGTAGVSPLSGAIYGNHAENWSSVDLTGKIYVPNVTVPASVSGAPLLLADYLKSVIPAAAQTSAGQDQEGNVIPPKTEVKEVPDLFIGAPTTARIRELGGWDANYEDLAIRFFPQDLENSPPLSGLRLSDSGQYYQNVEGQELVCEGDVVINGVLFLKDAAIRTSNSGCRLYVTKSVFVMNSFAFPGESPYRNLQISSSRAIVLGVGPETRTSNNYLADRMKNHWTHVGFHTRDASATTEQKNLNILNDSFLLSGYTDSVTHGRDKAFERVLFNAPQFHSRYQGHVSAVIISEVGLAALGEFKFEFSSVFSSTQVLPLLEPEEYLSF